MMTVEDFKRDVHGWAQRVGVRPKEIHVRSMKRKWGSCSTRGRLTFDVALLREGAHTRTHVILEELLHLRFPYHGRMFRSMLHSYLAQAGVSSSEGPAVRP